MAPHVVYTEAECPHLGCDRPLQAIDFRLEDHGRAVHDPLVTAWWRDTGFAGRCPCCSGWIHFTVRDKRAITEVEAIGLPRLPDDWHQKATILSAYAARDDFRPSDDPTRWITLMKPEIDPTHQTTWTPFPDEDRIPLPRPRRTNRRDGQGVV